MYCGGDAVVLFTGQRTCDSQVAGSSLDRAPPHNGLTQAAYNYICVPLSQSSIIYYRPMG